MAKRLVTDTGLLLATELRGEELGSPSRRLAALVIDGAILWLPSMIVALAVAWVVLAVREPAALRAFIDMLSGRLSTPETQHKAMQDLVPVLVKYRMPGVPAEVVAAYEAGDLERAAERLADKDMTIVLNADTKVIGAGSDLIRFEIDRLMPAFLRLLAFYGVAAAYFSLFTSRRSGATFGKRWLGLKVVRLDHQPFGLLASFERFVGYAQVPASLFTALIDFWRDPNRRLPHDRLSGTLVIRVRKKM